MLVHYTSNHLPLCSLTDCIVKRKKYTATEALKTKFVVHAVNVTKSALQTVNAVFVSAKDSC